LLACTTCIDDAPAITSLQKEGALSSATSIRMKLCNSIIHSSSTNCAGDAGFGLSAVFLQDTDCREPRRWTVVTWFRAVPNNIKVDSSHHIHHRLAGSYLPFSPSTCLPLFSEPRFLTIVLPVQSRAKVYTTKYMVLNRARKTSRLSESFAYEELAVQSLFQSLSNLWR
jgi:hypothetical protein